MTSPTSTFSPGDQHYFDTGPLSWVIGEIREALNRSKAALRESVAQDDDSRVTTLRHAKSYLHQAHGALQIVDVDGVAIITETVEDLLDRIDSGQIGLTESLVSAVEHGYQALAEYLEELLSGAPHQPVRLFPYYRALLEARGAERIHPADLFFPNLSIRPQFPVSEASIAQPGDYVVLRQRFERALLPFLKSSNPEAEKANAAVMRDLIHEIERKQGNHQSRGFWWVMHGFAEAVAAGQIRNEIYVKQVFARINLQMRRLSQGSSSIAERLLRDALFFIAQAAHTSPLARQIRSVYQLDGLVPEDYEKKRYGQVDTDALAAAKERLSHAKTMWNRIAGGDVSVAHSFEDEMHGLSDAGGKLNTPSFAKLLRELSGIARHAAHAGPGDILGLEIATSLLFVENALNQIGHLPENFAERAESMTARLLSIVAGERPVDSAEWLNEMAREAQQRQTMTALGTEMQSSLRQVEKMLDEYFRNPSQRSALVQLDHVLHQIEGALAILDQDDAVSTVQHTRAAVQRFTALESEAVPEQQDFQHVAQNVGALSFFIESLQLNGENAKNRFSFDQERGVFHANLIEPKSTVTDVVVDDTEQASVEQEGEPPFPDQAAAPSTVEEELAHHQRRSAELAAFLVEQPENSVLQAQLKESLEKIRLDARLIDHQEAGDRAKTGLDLLARPDFAASQSALADILAVTATPQPASEPLPAPAAAAPAPDTDEAADAELLEIFLLEADEVLACIRQTLPESRNAPHSQECLTTLRRSFHTLKGSGRMVGLTDLGEAAWSIEQVLNVRLSEAKAGDADLYALLDKAADLIEGWVEEIRRTGRSGGTPHALIAAAECVKAGEPFLYEEAEPLRVEEVTVVTEASALPLEDEAEPSAPAAEVFSANDGLPEESPAADFDPDTPVAINESALSIAPTSYDATEAVNESATEPVAANAVPVLPEPEEIELSGADPVISHTDEIAAPSEETEQPAEMLASSHGDDAQPREIAVDLEPAPVAEVIEFPTMSAPEVKRNDNVKRIGDLEISVPLHNIYLAETDGLVRVLAQDISEWRHEPERYVATQSVHAAHSLAGSSATVGFTVLQEVAHALEKVLLFLSRRPVQLAEDDFDTLDDSIDRMKSMLKKFALGEMPGAESTCILYLNRMLRSLDQRSGFQLHPDLAEEPPEEQVGIPVNALQAEQAPDAYDAAQLAQVGAMDAAASAAPVPEPVHKAAVTDIPGLKDELDEDLLPVFLEEGRDMLPQVGQALRSWHEQPGDPGFAQSLLRLLHTLKGSARMAGAMQLGQHFHEMETRIEILMQMASPSALAIEDLLIRYDDGLHLFERLQGAEAVPPIEAPATELRPVSLTSAAVRTDVSAAPSVPKPASASPIPVPLVRVRADLLDRLVNQAGEVSIARSKLETEVGALRQSMSELTENVARLRGQLREIEMQAESQITSRMAHSADREFDPLEFDRFTRLQELTRMMAESVSDVSSVQQNLNRTIDSAVDDLLIQGRLTRDLQQDLMRVRMVQFASISERLYRVTRQTAKEVDKRVNLDIRGASVEVDRSVLEKMTGPFEHLLRNAIVHGIESRAARRAAGKNETGELLIEIRQEGNEVVIQFSDDGQGLDTENIRRKARSTGLLKDDRDLSDDEVRDLIFHPGFSTAEAVTELAGRGIGMDVVKSEAAALGGRVATKSENGRGAQFTIHLPLTLSVTQVVLLMSGGRTYALPSVLVEQVQQLKANPLAAAYNDGAVSWLGQRVPMFYLPALLGDFNVSAVAQQYSPLLILKSGSDRVAIHVDEILGNREVVVKNIGPQLARVSGIAGATVLGSGEIVLILNPIPLAQRVAHENMRAPRLGPLETPDSMGAVAEMAPSQPSSPAGPVQGLRRQNIVMVVDDSLTVRRVTQRLLSREGYHVVLAKDGVDALEHLQSISPDVMLVDIEMPRMDGFDLTRNVRDDERTRDIPIIMITSRTAEKHRNYATELGVNEYLGKPYQEEQLLRLIADFIGKDSLVS
ncbi:MAG: response regulator [Noviherbaspirillum sp.]|nr:response regulator [Noviherbaspirillum sp.]